MMYHDKYNNKAQLTNIYQNICKKKTNTSQ